jgi:large subunit ribosomal protein L32
MAVPKRRTSKSKKRKRRNFYRAAAVAVQPCPRCGDPRRPHRVCPSCGYYAGEKEVEVEDVTA